MAHSSMAIPRAAPVSRSPDFWLELKRSRAAYLLLFPFLLHFVVVVAYPFAYSVYLNLPEGERPAGPLVPNIAEIQIGDVTITTE